MATLHKARGFLEVRETAVRAGANERDVDLRPGDVLAVVEAHIGERFTIVRRDGFADTDRLTWVDAPGHRGFDRRCIDHHVVVVLRVGVTRERCPPGNSAVPRVAGRGIAPTLQERERGVVRVHVTRARTTFDRHVADRHALVDRHAVDGRAAVFVRVADAAVDAESTDDGEDHVLRVNARLQRAIDVDAAHLQGVERQALRRQHVADLRRADAECKGAQRTVRGRVAIAARDRHPRLRESHLGTNHVNNALLTGGVVARRK